MTEMDDGNHQHTLREAISIIPAACYENPTLKAVSYLLWAAFIYGLALLGLFSTDNPVLLIPLWVLAGMSVSGLFILGHDACHGALFASKDLCRAIGRILMLPSLHIYRAWDMGHNRVHHSFTIRQHKDFVCHSLTADEYDGLCSLQKLVHRVEWSAFGAGVYYLLEVWWKKMIVLRPSNKMAQPIREDKRFVLYFLLLSIVGVVVLGQVMGAVTVYALWVWCKVIILPWLVFNHIIGATVYIHHIQPDIPWHTDGLWSKFKGQVEGTTNIRVPAQLNLFFYNIFVHVPHHVDPRIPFYNLPAAADAIRTHYREKVHDLPFRLRDYMQATKYCKLYDFDDNIWLDYRGRSSQIQRAGGVRDLAVADMAN